MTYIQLHQMEDGVVEVNESKPGGFKLASSRVRHLFPSFLGVELDLPSMYIPLSTSLVGPHGLL